MPTAELIRATENGVQLIAEIAKITHKQITERTNEYYLYLLYELGHLSVFEHVNFTYKLTCSRICAQQLTRHRLMSPMMRSQRYQDEYDFDYVVPPSIDTQDKMDDYNAAMQKVKNTYRELRGMGVSAEDARYVLPGACKTELYITTNLRELMHMCNERLCSDAQEEIRSLFEQIVFVTPEPYKYFLMPGCHAKHCFRCAKNLKTKEMLDAIHELKAEQDNR